MARFKSTNVSVLYKYMGDNIKLATLPAFPIGYLNSDDSNGRKLSAQELSLRIRVDGTVLRKITEQTGITERPTSVYANISADGTGYMYVTFPDHVDMSRWTVPYQQEAGKNKRLSNIATSYWDRMAQEATGLETMPVALAEQLYSTINDVVRSYIAGAGAVIRWQQQVDNAQNGIKALQAAGIPDTDDTYQALLRLANAPKPGTANGRKASKAMAAADTRKKVVPVSDGTAFPAPAAPNGRKHTSKVPAGTVVPEPTAFPDSTHTVKRPTEWYQNQINSR